MSIRVRVVVAIAVCSFSAFGQAQESEETCAATFAALLKEYNAVAGGIREASTDKQRKDAVDRIGPFADRFIGIAEECPGGDTALKSMAQAIQVVGSTDSAALISWETNKSDFPSSLEDRTPRRIMEILTKDYLLSPGLVPVCDRMQWGYRVEFEPFLRAVIDENPHREVKAVAALALANFLKDRLEFVRLVADRPELQERSDFIFGDKYLQSLRAREPAGMEKQIEELYEIAAGYEDVKTRSGESVAEAAERGLHGLRHLAIGKPAPEIEGVDQDGKPMQLAEYRGNVLLLYFWSEL